MISLPQRFLVVSSLNSDTFPIATSGGSLDLTRDLAQIIKKFSTFQLTLFSPKNLKCPRNWVVEGQVNCSRLCVLC